MDKRMCSKKMFYYTMIKKYPLTVGESLFNQLYFICAHSELL